MNRVHVELWEACMIFPDVLPATGHHGSLLQVLQHLYPKSSDRQNGWIHVIIQIERPVLSQISANLVKKKLSALE